MTRSGAMKISASVRLSRSTCRMMRLARATIRAAFMMIPPCNCDRQRRSRASFAQAVAEEAPCNCDRQRPLDQSGSHDKSGSYDAASCAQAVAEEAPVAWQNGERRLPCCLLPIGAAIPGEHPVPAAHHYASNPGAYNGKPRRDGAWIQ